MTSFQWKPFEVLNGRCGRSSAVLVLNTKIERFERLGSVWKVSAFRATADGGTNRLYDAVNARGLKLDEFFPDLISGDFDSIRPEVKWFYASSGAKVVHTPDQDATDFSKCIDCVLDEIKERNLNIEHFLAFVDTSGRFDQIVQNANEIIRRRSQRGLNIYLIANNSITWCLPPGDHEIHVSEHVYKEWCSVIPGGNKPSIVTTKGLKWDMTNDVLEYGGLISSSNTFTGVPVITLTNDAPVLFSIGLPDDQFIKTTKA